MVRHSPKKVATQEDVISGHFPNGDELTISSSLSRKPLSSISEGSRNSLSEKTSDENNCPEMPLMSKGKMTSDHVASKGKRKNSPMTSPAAPPRHSECNQEACANATPRTHRKLVMNESGEPGAAVAAASSPTFSAATPCKSATRSLRFGTSYNGGVLAATGTTSFFSTHRPGLPPVVSSGGQVLQQHASVETHFELEEDPTFWEDHNVQVLIRTRPISSSEMAVQGFSRCLKQENAHTISWIGQPESRFTFDHVADEAVTQEKLFKVAGLPMVENCMAGYNSCMFAYGQTGSGKTHTMLGDIENLENKPSDNRGMTPRVFEYLFARIRREEEEREMENLKFLTKCSFLEIYNEQITDLLEPSSTNLQMREDARKGVYVENLSEVEVHNVQDVIQLLIQGAANRKVAATNMNRESSRSHSVFTCIIESKWECDSMTNIRFGRLNLVDLAGSERQKSSGAEGERLKEAANINKSLSTLGLVIMILVDVANGKPRHVPYRDSKLTFLLQDSLGGNSKTTMIATVSPSSCNALETLSTLKFAQRAKLIHNTAVVNEDASGDVKALRAQIQQMKDELDRMRRQSISRIPLTQENFESIHHSFDSSVDSGQGFCSPKISNRKMRQLEAVAAGALRREQAADATAKRLAAEIEQLTRLVQQREADTQSSKMILRFREDKIRRLESLSKGLLSMDSHLEEEKQMLMQELQLMREKVDRNPELTRFAMENIRLLDQLCTLQDFQGGGEREVMMEEISNLRDQLLEVLDGKIAVEQGLVPLTTPQKKNLAPELAAAAREKELLRCEADNYRQVDELQAFVDQLREEVMGHQNNPRLLMVDILETEKAKHLEVIAQLQSQLEQSVEKATLEENMRQQLENHLKEVMEEAATLQNELEETKEALEAATALTRRLQSTEASLAAAQNMAQATVKQLRLETESVAVQQSQSLTDIQDVAVLWRTKENELRSQLEEALVIISKLSSGRETEMEQTPEKEEEMSADCAYGSSSLRGGEDGHPERLLRAQKVEMRHAEEIMQLQLELDSMEAVLGEERAHRKEVEEKLANLQGFAEGLEQLHTFDEGGLHKQRSLQLELEMASVKATLSDERVLRRELEEKITLLTHELGELKEVSGSMDGGAQEVRATKYFDAVARLQLSSPDQKWVHLSRQLEQEKVLVEALESQQLFAIKELEDLQAEHEMVLGKLKRTEDREKILRNKIHELMKEQELHDADCAACVEVLEEMAGGAMDDSQRLALEEKLAAATQEAENARGLNVKLQKMEQEKNLTQSQAETETALAITSIQSELLNVTDEAELLNKDLRDAREQIESLRSMLQDAQEQLLHLGVKYDDMLKAKNAEIQVLRAEQQSATAGLIDYLAGRDQALNEASLEVEQMFDEYLPQMDSSQGEEEMVLTQSAEKSKPGVAFLLKRELQHAQEQSRHDNAEDQMTVSNESSGCEIATMQVLEVTEKFQEVPENVEEMPEKVQADGSLFEVVNLKGKLFALNKNATLMSVMIHWFSQTAEARQIDLEGSLSKVLDRERLLLAVQCEEETSQSMLAETMEKLQLITEDLEKERREVRESKALFQELVMVVDNLHKEMKVLETKDIAGRTQGTQSGMHISQAQLENVKAEVLQHEEGGPSSELAQWEPVEVALGNKLGDHQATLDAKLIVLKGLLEELLEKVQTHSNAVQKQACEDCQPFSLLFITLENNHKKISLSNENSNILCLSTKRKEAAETAGTSDVQIQNLVAEEEQWEAAEPVLEHKLGDIQDEKENLDSELLEVEVHKMSPPQCTTVSPCEIQELGAPQVIGLQSEKGRPPNGENQERNVLSPSLKENIYLSSGDGVVDKCNHLSNNLKQELLKTRAECDNLRTKLRETDDTLLSVRMELEKSVVHYQEAEVERRREREENRKRIITLEDELRSTDEKSMHQQIQVEKFESELETLMSMVTETKQQMGASETDRRNEREQCEMEELEQAKLDEASDFRDEPEHMRRMCDESERLGHVSSMHAIGFSEIDCPEMHLDDLSLDTITEEVDLFIAHCLNQMGTLGLEMKSLRTDISGSFFQIPHAGLQQDVEKIFQAHRDEISVLIIKIAGMEELLEERSGKVSILQELLDAAQETLQSLASSQEKRELELHSSEASLEAAKAELEMSEAAVRELLDAARETDAVILDLKTNLQQRIEHETKVEAEVKVCQQQAQDVQLEMDELHATVGLLQQELATKEELIKELENSIQLLKKTVSSETEQKEEAIIQLQGELNSRNTEVCMLLDQQCKLEGDITKKIQELGLIKEELGTMNARVVQAVEERDGLCKQVQNMQFEMDQLKMTVKSLQQEIDTKEEFIMGLEKAGNSKTQQVEAIIQLQEELNSRNVELRLLVDQQYKLEGQITKKTEELGLVKEELGAMNTSVVQAVEERDILCKQIEDWKSKVMSLKATVVEQANEINRISSELHSEQALVKEHKLAADKARQAAETFKANAARTTHEMGVNAEGLGHSVVEARMGELTAEAERQYQMRMDAEKELQELKQQKSTGPDSGVPEPQIANVCIERKMQETELELSFAQKLLASLQAECEQKNAEIQNSNARISELVLEADRRESEHQHKVKGLESLLEQVSTVNSQSRAQGLSHHFSFGLHADYASKQRIEELESEVHLLNARLAESESMTHDVVRDLLGVKLEVSDYDRFHEQEIKKLRQQLNELIEERERWLEEINKGQAEIVAARVSAEKFRQRDQVLTTENEKIKAENFAHQTRIGDLEQEVRKLSGQQNLQQRIHHHAKIKDENNALRLQVEDLSGRLRSMEIMFARVKDELARYRTAAGRTAFPNLDEEQRLKSKLQEAANNQIEMAQNFISLCTRIMQAAGISNSGHVDQTIALEALQRIENRLQTNELELSELRLQTRIAGEKRRLSDMKIVDSPMKSINIPSAGYSKFVLPEKR
ncbi:unnamed protein product [Sphagnum troendelagicum]|uniref:Kinesin motor domain-containing protein n=1 Tax=Sphagnum troendelagicum TaxID=128251 RepID=A0ABP0TW97_9BRYO